MHKKRGLVLVLLVVCAISSFSVSALRIGVTEPYYNGNLGGITGADEICQSVFGNSLGGEWKALLRTQDRVAGGSDWVMAPNREYTRTDGSTIIGTTNSNGCLNLNLDNSVYGGAPSHDHGDHVWTGFQSGYDCDYNQYAYQHCSYWTDQYDSGFVGNVFPLTNGWLSNGSYYCNTDLRLYCVEQAEPEPSSYPEVSLGFKIADNLLHNKILSMLHLIKEELIQIELKALEIHVSQYSCDDVIFGLRMNKENYVYAKEEEFDGMVKMLIQVLRNNPEKYPVPAEQVDFAEAMINQAIAFNDEGRFSEAIGCKCKAYKVLNGQDDPITCAVLPPEPICFPRSVEVDACSNVEDMEDCAESYEGDLPCIWEQELIGSNSFVQTLNAQCMSNSEFTCEDTSCEGRKLLSALMIINGASETPPEQDDPCRVADGNQAVCEDSYVMVPGVSSGATPSTIGESPVTCAYNTENDQCEQSVECTN